MALPIVQIDAFTDLPFSGNPAAVCLLSGIRDDRWMQDVAREMNLSETAFLLYRAAEDGYDLRWFTPRTEVDLCGHATLASAHYLWESGRLEPSRPARFFTKSGLLSAVLRPEGWIEMDFPAEPEHAAPAPPALLAGLGIAPPLYVGRNRFDYLVEIESERQLRSLAPDFGALREVQMRGVMVTCRSARPGADFLSRFFAPAVGIDEDPVTGSAHCCLGPYWQKRMKRFSFYAEQVSARGGTLHVRVAGDRVVLAGRAVTVVRGELLS